jgi:glycosyltransferase involved in cell wall biosynthesis
MIWLSHPTGNSNVRHALMGLEKGGLEPEYYTSVGWRLPFHPSLLPIMGGALQRRDYSGFHGRITFRPWLEIQRLFSRGSALSVFEVAADLDRHVSQTLAAHPHPPTAVYGYEDCAAETFRKAAQRNVKCIYELPIAYWSTAADIYREEAERLPEWAPTLGGLAEPEWKIERKICEAELADAIICPSRFVLESLPLELRAGKLCQVAHFGGPMPGTTKRSANSTKNTKLRVLFAGSMTQRKGLADLFSAMRLLNRNDVELVVMGSLCAPMEFYRQCFKDFIYEPPRAHAAVLDLMRSCDVLLLPSLVEGRALVQQEAMSCGLPLIATVNAGAEDLIEDGKTGFVVPCRKPDALAEKIAWCADHRLEVKQMGVLATKRASHATWEDYESRVCEIVKSVIP